MFLTTGFRSICAVQRDIAASRIRAARQVANLTLPSHRTGLDEILDRWAGASSYRARD